MRIFFSYIGVLCFFLPLIGCADPALPQGSNLSKDRLTIQDLQPNDVHLLQPQIFFNWVEFEIGIEFIPDIIKNFNQFSSKNILFQNASLYEQNGISIFVGKSGQGPSLTEALIKFEAKSIKRTMLMTLSQTPEFYSTSSFPNGSLIYFTSPTNQTISREYPSGQFGFTLTAALTLRRDRVDMECKPAFMPAIRLSYYKDKTASDYDATNLPPGHFTIQLTEGDFLIFAPNRNSPLTTLDNALFKLSGKKDRTRIYVLVLARVEY